MHTKSSRIKLPEVHGVKETLDTNTLPEKQKIAPQIERTVKIKPRLGEYQEGITSETYQRPDKSYFQEPQELGNLMNQGRLVQKFLPKQTDIDKILKIIQQKILKGTHLPVMVKRNTGRIRH